MDNTNLALFVVASWILVVTPGPDMLYVITRGISQGRKSGVVSAIGVTLGILVHTLFAAFGFAVILKTSAVAFGVVKYLGALYAVADRTPRVYPWMNEPGGGILAAWNILDPLTAYTICDTT